MIDSVWRHPSYRQIWQKVDTENGIITDLREAERELKYNEHKVLLWCYPDFPMMFDSYPCEVVAAKRAYLKNFGVYPFNKKSQFIKLFNHQINDIREHGWETEYFDSQPGNNRCDDAGGNHFRKFTYEDVISVFVVCGIGCVVAVGYSMLEWTYMLFHNQSNTKHN